MHARSDDPASGEAGTRVERRSDRELEVTRIFDAPARLVFAAWTRPELLMRWWAPKSMDMQLVSCVADVRVGGRYRFEFGRDSTPLVAFFGQYLEVVPDARLVWTNEESPEGAVSTLSLAESGGRTILTLHEVYPTRAALDLSFEGMEGGLPEQFAQLDALLSDIRTVGAVL